MTKDEIIDLARQSGFRRDMFGLGIWDQEEFINFANLVAKKERERCAKELDRLDYWYSASAIRRLK